RHVVRGEGAYVRPRRRNHAVGERERVPLLRAADAAARPADARRLPEADPRPHGGLPGLRRARHERARERGGLTTSAVRRPRRGRAARSRRVARHSSAHPRRTRARVVISSPATVHRLSTARSRPWAVKSSEAIPARSSSAAGWIGRRRCTAWNHSGSWLAGKVIGENRSTKNTSTWEMSWASIAGKRTAIA